MKNHKGEDLGEHLNHAADHLEEAAEELKLAAERSKNMEQTVRLREPILKDIKKDIADLKNKVDAH